VFSTYAFRLLGRTRMCDVTGIVDVERDRRWRRDADVDMSLLNWIVLRGCSPADGLAVLAVVGACPVVAVEL
jgi:hypothetical protein